MKRIEVFKKCAMCEEIILYNGHPLMQFADMCCGEVCERLYDVITPGRWISSDELGPGGRFYKSKDDTEE